MKKKLDSVNPNNNSIVHKRLRKQKLRDQRVRAWVVQRTAKLMNIDI